MRRVGTTAALALLDQGVKAEARVGKSTNSDCVAQLSDRPEFGHPVSLLRKADVLWTLEFEHPVHRADRNRDLGRSTAIDVGS